MSWEQLQAIIAENKEQARVERHEPPATCPIDGSTLEINAKGVRNCPMGNYRWDGEPKVL